MQLLGISGRKQSGKNTAFNFLLSLSLVHLGLVRGKASMTSDGKVYISDLFGDTDFAGVFDVERDNPAMRQFLEDKIYPFLKNYSFADLLKKNVCIDVLGLTREQCYGTDAQKDSPTHLRWEDMPGVITEMLPELDESEVETVGGRLGPYYQRLRNGVVYHKAGPMTGREVLQFVGTEIFRKMYGNVWADSTLRRIISEDSQFAVITDVRFPNEVEAIKKAGGKVLRLTRNGEHKDVHVSETALDQDKYDWSNFDAVLDNSKMSILEQNTAFYSILVDWGWFDQPVTER